MALNRSVSSRTSVGPSSGSGPGSLIGRSAVASASRRSGPVTERLRSQAIGAPATSTRITTNGNVRVRSRSASEPETSGWNSAIARGPVVFGPRSVETA